VRITIQEADTAFSPRPLPAWARPKGTALQDLDAGLFAGATLAALDTIVRAEPAFAGLWRNRLALSAAAASVRLIGRREEAAELRDAWFLRRREDDLGPAGAHLLAWRSLARSSPAFSPEMVRRAAEAFGLHAGDLPREFLTLAENASRNHQSPLHSAALVAAEVSRIRPQAELVGYWLADLVLAYRLRWPFALPLLASQIANTAPRNAAGLRSSQPTAEGWEKLVTVAYAHAAAAAVDLAGDLARRATKLTMVAPKLRAKGAANVVASLLDDDAIAASSEIVGMSDRGLRRLCDRLVSLGAVRELTNRPAFRLYGL